MNNIQICTAIAVILVLVMAMPAAGKNIPDAGRVTRRTYLTHHVPHSTKEPNFQLPQFHPRFKRSNRMRICGNVVVQFLNNYCAFFKGSESARISSFADHSDIWELLQEGKRRKRDLLSNDIPDTRDDMSNYSESVRYPVGLSDACCRKPCTLSEILMFC